MGMDIGWAYIFFSFFVITFPQNVKFSYSETFFSFIERAKLGEKRGEGSHSKKKFYANHFTDASTMPFSPQPK